MARIGRVVIPGVPHHVTQRGNGRQIVFDADTDRLVYLDLLRKYSEEYRLTLWAWCLMSNHIHLLAVPERPNSLDRALARTHSDYARYLNIKRRSCGHVWQARFYSCPVGADHIWTTMAYIEQNPARAGLVEHANEYHWSSALAHATGSDNHGLIDLRRWRLDYTAERWRLVLASTMNEEAEIERLRRATLRGRPFCAEDQLNEFERNLGRRLRPMPVGRPRKQARSTALSSSDALESPA
jgi:putative transposase